MIDDELDERDDAIDNSGPRNFRRDLDVVEQVLRIALDAHLAVSMRWPHYAMQACLKTAAAATLAAETLQSWVSAQDISLEASERREGMLSALDEVCARATAERIELADLLGVPK